MASWGARGERPRDSAPPPTDQHGGMQLLHPLRPWGGGWSCGSRRACAGPLTLRPVPLSVQRQPARSGAGDGASAPEQRTGAVGVGWGGMGWAGRADMGPRRWALLVKPEGRVPRVGCRAFSKRKMFVHLGALAQLQLVYTYSRRPSWRRSLTRRTACARSP